MSSILKVNTLQDAGGNAILTSDGSGKLTTQKINYPAFEASLSSTQSVSNDTTVKIQINSEILDTDNCYDNSTNYRFTPTVAGKYFVYAKARGQSSGDNLLRDINLSVYKNGSLLSKTTWLLRNNYERAATPSIFNIVDMNGSSDYVELFGYINVNSGTPKFGVGTKSSSFGAYRIGT